MANLCEMLVFYFMPTVELILLLLFIGAATGSISAVINIAPALIAIPTLYFFLPVFDLSFQNLMLPTIATCIAAFVPAHLYAWIQSMQRGEVDSQNLIRFAPGIAMGGVIGAQVLSLIGLWGFKIAFSFIAAIAIANILFHSRLETSFALFTRKRIHLPIGLMIGTISLLSGNCGGVLAKSLCILKKIHPQYRQGTTDGLVVFASIAAIVGFVYPAKGFDEDGVLGFAGAIHLPSALILGCSHLFFYQLCRHKGNALDKRVLSISCVIFMACSVLRLWVS
jgi:uncharacterized protein